MRKIIFISSALQQPRHQKRIDILSKNFDLEVYYFFRDKYTQNYKNYSDGAKLISNIEDGKYINRLSGLFKLFSMLKKSNIESVYCTSPDQALVSLLAGKITYFEVGDLYQIDGRNKVYQYLDEFIIPRISGLILTSPYFYDGYYIKYENFIKNKVIIVENKLPINFSSNIDKYRLNYDSIIDKENVKLGLIGSLAFTESLNLINNHIENSTNQELHIFGVGKVGLFDGTPHTFYHGPFKSPEDLSSIYKKIDINIILYDYDNNNVKLALPNKLYESIAFLKPIVCADNVALSSYVLKNNIGVVVKDGDLNTAIQSIVDNYDYYVDNLKKMSQESYLCFEQNDILKLFK